MFDPEDDATRFGVVTALGITLLVLFGLIGGLILRHIGDKAPAAATAAAPAIGVTTVTEVILIDVPLSGDLVSTLYFETGSAALPANHDAEVQKARAALDAAPGKRLVVSGFHDATGSAARNAELARDRAVAVGHALVAAGIEPARVAFRKPGLTTGDGPPEEARRVEIRIAD